MPAYLLIDTVVHDREVYKQYVEAFLPILESFGGEYIVSSEKITSFVGGWEPKRIVMLRFPDAERLRACFASEEYTAVKHLQQASCGGRTIMVED
jgi:uncharacterized protein (DUF1330 family)